MTGYTFVSLKDHGNICIHGCSFEPDVYRTNDNVKAQMLRNHCDYGITFVEIVDNTDFDKTKNILGQMSPDDIKKYLQEIEGKQDNIELPVETPSIDSAEKKRREKELKEYEKKIAKEKEILKQKEEEEFRKLAESLSNMEDDKDLENIIDDVLNI